MNRIADVLKPGQIARVRQRTYLVEQIVRPKRSADSTLVKLSCVDDDNPLASRTCTRSSRREWNRWDSSISGR